MDFIERILVSVSDDEMECRVTIIPPEKERDEINIMDFIDFLGTQGILYGLDEYGITENIIAANENGSQISFIAARGVPPVHGKDGVVIPRVIFPLEERRTMIRKVKTVKSGAKVTAGQIILEVNNTNLEGVDGTTVMGHSISAKTGKPLKLIAGKNIRTEKKDGHIFYSAAIDGIAYLENDELIYLKTYSDGYFDIQVKEDNLSLLISIYPPRGNGRFVESREIVENLISRGLPMTDRKLIEIRRLIYQVSSDAEEVTDYPLYRGTPPENGQDETITFKVNTSPKRIFSETNKKMDFHSIMEINSVRSGQLLAVKTPATPGTKAGVNIFNEPVPPRDGAPLTGFQTGKNVVVSDDGLSFFASVDGQVKFKNGVMRVDSVFLVNGDLNFSVGNINFVGDVIIQGDVLDNFSIKADGNVFIYGNVGMANIYAGHDLIVKGGIINKKKSGIIVKGNLRCRFIENSSLEIDGDCLLEDYILQSNVTCQGMVRLLLEMKGQIVGGELIARKGLECKILGNETEVQTKIFAGKTLLLKRLLETAEKTILDLQMKMTNLNQTLTAEKENENLCREILKEKVMLNFHLTRTLNTRTHLLKEAERRESCYIRVREEIWPQSELNLNDRKILIHQMTSFQLYFYDPDTDNIHTRQWDEFNS